MSVLWEILSAFGILKEARAGEWTNKIYFTPNISLLTYLNYQHRVLQSYWHKLVIILSFIIMTHGLWKKDNIWVEEIKILRQPPHLAIHIRSSHFNLSYDCIRYTLDNKWNCICCRNTKWGEFTTFPTRCLLFSAECFIKNEFSLIFIKPFTASVESWGLHALQVSCLPAIV